MSVWMLRLVMLMKVVDNFQDGAKTSDMSSKLSDENALAFTIENILLLQGTLALSALSAYIITPLGLDEDICQYAETVMNGLSLPFCYYMQGTVGNFFRRQ